MRFMFDRVGECLLNAFEICVGEVVVFSWKIIGLCWFLLANLYNNYGLPKSMFVLFVFTMCVYVFPPYVRN